MNDKELNLLEAEGDYYILVLTKSFPGSYGKAKTLKQAKKNCLFEHGSTDVTCIGYLAHRDVEVTEMGGWCRPHNVPDPIRLGQV